MAGRVYRSRRHHHDLTERLIDSGIGFAIGAVVALVLWLATVWWVMH